MSLIFHLVDDSRYFYVAQAIFEHTVWTRVSSKLQPSSSLSLPSVRITILWHHGQLSITAVRADYIKARESRSLLLTSH